MNSSTNGEAFFFFFITNGEACYYIYLNKLEKWKVHISLRKVGKKSTKCQTKDQKSTKYTENRKPQMPANI